MKYVSLIACLLFSLNTFAARAPRVKDEVAKIAVGPDATEEDATDAVDKPIRKPKVIVTDAPGDVPAQAPAEASGDSDADAELSAAAAASAPAPASAKPVAPAKPATKATGGRPVRDEGTISIHGVDEQQVEAHESDENPTAKIDTSKPKAEVLKPTSPVTPPRVQKPGKVPPTIDAVSAAPAAAPAAPAKVVDGVSPEQSLKWLENGNTRYVTKKFRADGRSEKERANKTAKPHAIVLSCSDSRVPPELIFDQGLGEITTIRTAGEVLDLSIIASIEQSIINDHPHLLVVLGHTQCTSIEQALQWKDTPSFGSDALDRMVSEIKPHLKTATGPRSPGLQIESALQADGVARDLPEHSAIIKKAVDSGELTIKTGLYWIDTGKVKFY